MLFFHSVGNVIIPTDELIFFRGVGIPPTSFFGVSAICGETRRTILATLCQSAEMINSVSVKGRRMGRFTDGNQNTQICIYIYT